MVWFSRGRRILHHHSGLILVPHSSMLVKYQHLLRIMLLFCHFLRLPPDICWVIFRVENCLVFLQANSKVLNFWCSDPSKLRHFFTPNDASGASSVRWMRSATAWTWRTLRLALRHRVEPWTLSLSRKGLGVLMGPWDLGIERGERKCFSKWPLWNQVFTVCMLTNWELPRGSLIAFRIWRPSPP